MNSVNLSAQSRTGLSVLRNVADQISATQTRLSTGKAVNSPFDNVRKFFTADRMDTRAASIDVLMDSVATAQSSLKAASEGIKGIQGLIKEARSLASQALSSTSNGVAKATGNVALNGAVNLVTNLGYTAGNQIRVSDGTKEVIVNVAASTTVAGLMSFINGEADFGVTAAIEGGNLTLTGETGKSFSISGAASGVGLTTGIVSPENATRASLSRQFDALRSEIDQIAKDAGINGTNLLAGDKLKVVLNEDASSSVAINGADITATSLNIGAASGRWQGNHEITDSLDALIAASESLEATASTLTSNHALIGARSKFNTALSDILKSSANELTEADMDLEAANLMALQVRQQMATTALSIMQSSETTALRLLN